ncbi:MAG: hypothetical protein DMD61_01025 [Gemmatimonadetes bacterium]|nr:MAG: hypothetical protein DMD61_01025 [Gemmatimonadota bacterium]
MTRPRVAAALFLLLAVGCKKPVKPGDPIPGLTAEQLARFNRGKEVFDSVFTPHSSRRAARSFSCTPRPP